MSERINLEPVYVLRAQAYRESSLILEVFSARYGRQGIVARGVRSQRSRIRGVLQPFQPLLMSWRIGADLGTLSAAESAGSAPYLSGEAVFLGWYLNELVLRFLPRHDPHPDLYAHYVEALNRILSERDTALRRFEKRLLESVGYGFTMPAARTPSDVYRFHPESGFEPVCSGSRHAISGVALRDLIDERFEEPGTRLQIRALLRKAIDWHMGDQPLRTRALLRAMNRFNFSDMAVDRRHLSHRKS